MARPHFPLFDTNRRRRWKRARRQKKRSSQKTNNLRTKKFFFFVFIFFKQNSCRFFHGAVPTMVGGAMPGQLQNGASAYYAQQQQQSPQPPGRQRYRGYRSIITINTPARLDRNRMLLTVVIIIATRRTLVVEVGISSCTLGLQILHRNSRRIYPDQTNGRRRILSKRAPDITANRRISDIQSTRRLSINRPPRR